MRVYLDKWEKELILASGGGVHGTPAVEECQKVRVHARGLFPERLFQTRFPTEPDETFEYRRANYLPITQSAYQKIFNTVVKIASEPEFQVVWPSESADVQRYCEEDYPITGGFLSWLFDSGLHAQLIEPNGVIAIIPYSYEWGAGELPRPYARVFKVEDVIYHDEERLSILREADGTFLYINTELIARVEIVDYKSIKTTLLFQHNFGSAPTFLIGGDETDYHGEYYQSLLAGCVPHWDAAVLDSSVLRAAIHGHVYPEYQLLETEECESCKGKGTLTLRSADGLDYKVTCKACSGTGSKHSPGFGNISVRLNDLRGREGDPMPTGPVKQYISKDFSSIPVLQEQIDKSLYYAYSAVNMEFLAEIPANQSGIAKAYDRAYLNSFLSKVARFLLNKMAKWSYYYIIMYREIWPYISAKDEVPFSIMELMPSIQIPEKFEVLPQDTMLSELQAAKAAGAPPPVIDGLQSSLIANSLVGSPEEVKEFEVIKALDPLYGYTISDKLAIKAQGGVSQEDFILSINIPQWVKYASKHETKDGKSFLDWTEEDQKEYLDGKARLYALQASSITGSGGANGDSI